MSYTGGSEFVEKLFTILEEKQNFSYISWDQEGKSLLIKDADHIGEKVLINYFRHGNLATLIRQLNKYGFSKMKSSHELVKMYNKDILEFYHKNFLKGRRDLLHFIKRKKTINHRNCVIERTYAFQTLKNLINLQSECAHIIQSMMRCVSFLKNNVNSMFTSLDSRSENNFQQKVILFEDYKSRISGISYILNEIGLKIQIAYTESDFFNLLYLIKSEAVVLNCKVQEIDKFVYEIRQISPLTRIVCITKDNELTDSEKEMGLFMDIDFVRKDNLRSYFSYCMSPNIYK